MKELRDILKNKLEGLNYPEKWSEQLEMEILEIRGKNYEDNNEIELPKCYNCLHENPLINKNNIKIENKPFFLNIIIV